MQDVCYYVTPFPGSVTPPRPTTPIVTYRLRTAALKETGDGHQEVGGEQGDSCQEGEGQGGCHKGRCSAHPP